MQTSKPIPQVKGEFLLGNIRQVLADPFQALINFQQDYGDIVAFSLANQRFYLLSHPDYVEQCLVKQTEVFVKGYHPGKPTGIALVLGQGLFTSRGETWQKQRRLMQPIFQKVNLAALFPQMLTAGQNLLNRWQQLPANHTVNLCDEMMRVALEVITQTMFSTSVLDKVSIISPALATVLRYAALDSMNPLTPPLYIPTPANLRFKRAMTTLDQVIYEIIANRRQSGKAYIDLLQLLLTCRDEQTGTMMSDQQIRDEVMTIFTAGHETTANLLSWSLYLLARHPDILARLRQEVDTQLPDELSGFDDLQGLVYTKAVLQEAMRMYPPAGAITRLVNQDFVLHDYLFKAGSLIVISIYNLHHHAAFWPHSEQFDPERFLSTENRRFHYIPFGIGERICIGNHFAMLETQLLLALLVKQFEIELLDSTAVVPELTVSIHPKGGLPVRIKPRQINSAA